MRISDLHAAVQAVAADPPTLGRWEEGYGANPLQSIGKLARKFGWPYRMEVVVMPSRSAPRRGERPPKVDQLVLVVPETWLRAVADRLSVPYQDCYRRLIGPAEGE